MTPSDATHEATHVSSLIFNTLAYAKKLKAAGVPEAQAEIQAETMAEVIEEKLATKQDLFAVKQDIKDLRTELRHEMQNLEKRLSYELTLRFGGMLTAAVTILAVLIKIL